VAPDYVLCVCHTRNDSNRGASTLRVIQRFYLRDVLHPSIFAYALVLVIRITGLGIWNFRTFRILFAVESRI
jgi:hypothetical protein